MKYLLSIVEKIFEISQGYTNTSLLIFKISVVKYRKVVKMSVGVWRSENIKDDTIEMNQMLNGPIHKEISLMVSLTEVSS